MEQEMTSDGDDGTFMTAPLPGVTFGKAVRLRDGGGAARLLAAMQADPDGLPGLLYANDGLLMLPRMDGIADDPTLLVALSRFFGPEVENYRETLTLLNRIHETVPEIMIVSNTPPTKRKPPALPEPPLTADGKLPTQFPHRRGWHTDQSYRRPPPDISLFFAVRPTPQGQGQTLFANGYAAYEALPPGLKRRVDGLVGLHVKLGTGRAEKAVRAGEPLQPLLPHEQPQRQPVVRVHPVTGRRALYLCEASQMDWVDGPFVGMEPGPDGEGARLLYEIMAHYTQPQFTYVHEWTKGDLVIWDNRNLVHVATWFDADKYGRVMWRTTVRGNPGAEYAGERRSWIPAADEPAPAA
jgi:alpha-ketoglutarate-dependent taurine dioxygenase